MKAENLADHATWLQGLTDLRYRSQHKKKIYKEADWIDDLFVQADLDKSGQLSVEECFKLLNNMGVPLDKKRVKKVRIIAVIGLCTKYELIKRIWGSVSHLLRV